MTEKIFPFATVLAFFLSCADIPDELREEAEGKRYIYCVLDEQQMCIAGSFAYSDCSGKPSDKCPYDSAKVCEGIFNPLRSFCYDGNVYSKCGGMIYNPSTHICQGAATNLAICGGSQYNPLEQRCQGDVVETRCGGNWHALDSNQRCQNNIVEIQCGSRWYNDIIFNLFSRCQSDVIETRCGSDFYNPSTQFCFNGVYNKCSGQSYTPASQRCENNVVETRCGNGSDFYNPSTQFCNENSIYDKCGGREYDLSNQRCQSNVVENKCGSDFYNPSTQFCNENSIYNKCGGREYDLSNQRCQGNVVESKCGSDWYSPATRTRYCKNGTALAQYGSLEYAGQTYRTVAIGEQVWMAENLNYNATGSKCYNNMESNCATYGRLYNRATAMTVCPGGWHLPSGDEWRTLINFVGGFNAAGTKLKSSSGWNSYSGIVNLDSYGFSALPGGGGRSDGGSAYVGDIGYWWSSEGSYYYAYHVYMLYSSGYVNLDNRVFPGNSNYTNKRLYSVRCLKD